MSELKVVEPKQAEKKSLVKTIAHKYGVEEAQMLNTLKATCFKQQGDASRQVSNEQMMALLVVANEYNLNPFTREIYAFPQNGGIVPIVGIDGWMNIINSHPQFNGMTFEDNFDENNKLVSCTCTMYRKDREHPTVLTEYLSECIKSTDPWKTKPVRMLRHKTAIQSARYTFSFSGIFDEDEAADIQHNAYQEPAAEREAAVLPGMTDEDFAIELDNWKVAVLKGKKTADEILAMVNTRYSLDEDQIEAINGLG